MFGGTSMAAPLVAGSTAVVMEGLQEKNQNYDSFRIKNILMSTATDIYNDPFAQGSGFVNSYQASQFVNGQGGVFVVYNNSTYGTIKEILDLPTQRLNQTLPGFDVFKLSDKSYPSTSWFGGRLEQGEKSTTTYTIENSGNKTIIMQDITQKL
jgi:subtilase family serine protease